MNEKTTYRVERPELDIEKLFSELDSVNNDESESDDGYEKWRIIDFREEIMRLMKKHETSVAKICRYTGVSQGVLYNYLKRKKDMYGGNIEKVINYLRSIV